MAIEPGVKPLEDSGSYPFFFTWSAQVGTQPVHLAGGEGTWFLTSDGGRWLDMGSLIYQANLGHGHPRMIEAVRRQASELCLSVPNAVFPVKVELAERLLALAPPGFTKVFFTLGGAEANENALKMARMVTGRHKTISRYRSYHGATLGALALTGDWRRPPLEPLAPGAVHALDCYCDRCPFGRKVESCSRECAGHIGELLDLEGAGTVAAVFLEPIPGANGVLVPPPGYWSRIREACDRHGTLLVADEVLTGFGRTGRWLGIHHEEGVVPDFITLAKGLTGGYATLGAVLVHERVARYFEDHVLVAGLTGYSHPVSCAAALEAIKVYEEEGLIERAARLEGPFLGGLRDLASRHPEVRFVRGRGLLGGLELEVDGPFMQRLQLALRRRRLYAHVQVGARMVILAPPLCIQDSELELGLSLLSEGLGEAAG